MVGGASVLANEAVRRRSAELGPGVKLGRYEILAPLGRGGMAQVWIGRATGHGSFERLLAIKTVAPSLVIDEPSRRLFMREAQVAASIRHVNVVDMFDFGEDEGILYQIMSLVEGDSLAGLWKHAPPCMPATVLVTIMADALRGLHAAHESVDERGQPRALVHRDVSPQNILVGLDGVARVSDFGVAKVVSNATSAVTTSLRGKAGYLSPEQVRDGRIDRRTDVFGMGIVLWEGLTGRRLFRSNDLAEAVRAVTSMAIPHPCSEEPEAPKQIAAVAMHALQRDPDGRFASAEAMREALLHAAKADSISTSADEVASFVERLVGDSVRGRMKAALPSGAAPVAAEPAPAAIVDDPSGTVSYVPTLVDPPVVMREDPTMSAPFAAPPVSGIAPAMPPTTTVAPAATSRSTWKWVFIAVPLAVVVLAAVVYLRRPPAKVASFEPPTAATVAPHSTPITPPATGPVVSARPPPEPPASSTTTAESPHPSRARPEKSQPPTPPAHRAGHSVHDPPYAENPFAQ